MFEISKHKWVYQSGKKWEGKFTFKGKSVYVGAFDTELECANAVKKRRDELQFKKPTTIIKNKKVIHRKKKKNLL